MNAKNSRPENGPILFMAVLLFIIALLGIFLWVYYIDGDLSKLTSDFFSHPAFPYISMPVIVIVGMGLNALRKMFKKEE